MIKRAVRSLLHCAGYTLAKYRTRAGGFDVDDAPQNVRYDSDMEPEFQELHTHCHSFAMTPPERAYNLYLAMRHVLAHNIPGDIVKCGVWCGGSAMLCAQMLQRARYASRKVYLYDTFGRMAAPTEKETDAAGLIDTREIWGRSQTAQHKEWCHASLEDVRANMASTGFPSARTLFVKGKVAGTLPFTLPDRIALFRLDTDWHDSTVAELTHMYLRLSPIGVLIVDDYGQWRGRRTAVDEFLAGQKIPLLLARIDAAARMGIKPNN